MFPAPPVADLRPATPARAGTIRATRAAAPGWPLITVRKPAARQTPNPAHGADRLTSTSARLVFCGEVLDGFDPAKVRQQLGEQLKLDPGRLDHLFSGRRVVIKRSIDHEQGLRHVQQFARLGARLLLEDSAAPAAPAAAPAAPAAPAAAAAVSGSTPAPIPATAAASPGPHSPLAGQAEALSLVPLEGELPQAEATITCPTCGEVQPQAVFCRSCVTNMPMGIAARAEAQARPTPGVAESAGRPEARGAAPVRGRPSSEEAPDLPPPARLLGLGFAGRMARAPYLAAGMASMLLGSLIVLWALHKPSMGRIAVVGLVWLALVVYGLRLGVLRCHDCNRSGWWSVLQALPVVGGLATLALALLRGTDGDNRFGQAPEEASPRPYAIVSTACALALALVVRPALEELDVAQAASSLGRQAKPAAAAAPATYESEAARIYATEYAAAPHHKAFAISGKAWGWRSGMASAQEAAEQALANCEQQREPHTEACELVSVDDAAYGPVGR